MIKISCLYLNFSKLGKEPRNRVTGNSTPCFSWAVNSDCQNSVQTACRIRVWVQDEVLWDTNWIDTAEQQITYGGKTLPAEKRITFSVCVKDNHGDISESSEDYFFLSNLEHHQVQWIASPEDHKGKAVYFRRSFDLKNTVKHAALYICGLGYYQLTLNGQTIDNSLLNPAISDYTRTVYYVMIPEMEHFFAEGTNCFGVVLGEGWRRNEGPYLKCIGNRRIDFFGMPQLSLLLSLKYSDGSTETIGVDEQWLCSYGAIVYNHLFNGEVTDMRSAVSGWDLPKFECSQFSPARFVPSPGGHPVIMELEPIREQEIYPALTLTPIEDGTRVIDFGQNIAGVCCLRLPKNMTSGQSITISHMEFLDEDGSLYLPNLRAAKCQDTYIASGDERDLVYWQPQFTYHGFRYVQISGHPLIDKEDICAVSMYTNVKSDSFFSSGSGLVNTIQKAIVQTEKSNIYSILTDCPQRDERMGWLNDATVRFEETPYNFNIGRLFPKVIQDILDTQESDGSISCTAPRVYGERPADPVCSSFLVAGMQVLLHTGNLDIIRKAYTGFVQWQNCLSAYTDNFIVTYSYYGDWAGPVYACVNGDCDINAVLSLDTPGIFMSTGYYYYNAVLLSKFAAILNLQEEQIKYTLLAEQIRKAMLDKWWSADTGKMATGSQGCQSFALWLGILPEESRQLAAERLHEDLVERNYHMTTANLCTRYLMDALTDYGYVDDAWRLLTSEDYPSIGYMLQHEATTIWERFELKKEPGMNSHNHPMYGAVGYWLYAYIAGIKPTAPGFSEVDIRPYFPEKLLSAHASVDTIKGELTVRWVKRYGKLYLYVTVPFGVKANVYFDNKCQSVGSGFWIFSKSLS